MKIKNAILMIFVCAIIFCLSGCEKTGCTMTVLSSYSGTGIDGQDLGSGSFSETFSVSAGDVFYEGYNGHWKRENINGNENILKIIDINNDGVTVKIDDEEITMQYGRAKYVNSKYTVYDGENYKYSISFSRD